jgi:hypothetical protein
MPSSTKRPPWLKRSTLAEYTKRYLDEKNREAAPDRDPDESAFAAHVALGMAKREN